MDHVKHIEEAYSRIADVILRTPLLYSAPFSKESGARVYLKLESEQITNSFKLRGASSKIKLLFEQDPDRLMKHGLVTASSGNHGVACAYICSKLDVNLTVYTSKHIAEVKEKNLQLYKNATLVKHSEEAVEAEMYARSLATEKGLQYISPYNDLDVVHGQGTIGLEIFDQLPDADFVFVPVGGGGLIGGIALYLKSKNPHIQIIGCQAENDAAMMASLQAGKVLDIIGKPSLADGIAGNIEQGSVTFSMCKQYVDEWVMISEFEIGQAVYDMMYYHKKLVEGAAGLAIAAMRRMRNRLQGKQVILLMCGSNIGIDTLKCILETYC